MAENTEIQRRIHDERGVRSGNRRRHNENVGRFASRSHGAFVEIATAHQNGMDAQIRRDRVCHALEKCVRHLSAYRVVNSFTQSPQRRIPGENRASKRGAGRRLGSAPSIRSRQERSKGQNPENTRETGELGWEIGWRPCRNGNLL